VAEEQVVNLASASPSVGAAQVLPSRRTIAWLDAILTSLSPWHLVATAMFAGAMLRIWRLDELGYNSDEAVYAGQAAAFVNDPKISPFFPLVRAHPMLFQFTLAMTFHYGVTDIVGRLVSVLLGLGTVLLVYLVGRTIYDGWTGAIAALFLALMPYHVVVSRQVLLDGPMTFFATLTLLLIAKYGATHSSRWLWAAAAGMGMTFLAKETGIVLVASVYAFLALCMSIPIRLRDVIISSLILAAVVISFPVSLLLAGGGASEKAQGYLVWQLLRKPNHVWTFYPSTVPIAMGVLVVATAVAGLWFLRRQHSWRENLLNAWIAVPVIFFQLWPVKGFQYLLPTAPCVVLLASRMLRHWSLRPYPWLAASGLTVVPNDHRGGPGVVAGGAGVEPGRDRAKRPLAGGIRRHAGRPRDRRLDPPERAAGRSLPLHRPLDGERRPVLRASPGVRIVREPQPAHPQPFVRADPQCRPQHPHRRGAVPGL
jgi:hypothetical protein